MSAQSDSALPVAGSSEKSAVVPDAEQVPRVHAAGEDVIIEGWLEKKSRAGIPSMRPWKKKYFVLLRASNELRYYNTMVGASAAGVGLGLPLWALG